MRLWLSLKDIFSFDTFSSSPPELLFGIYPSGTLKDPPPAEQVGLENIRFDNTIRILISIMTLAICVALWVGKVINHIAPILYVFTGYTVLELGIICFLLKSSHYRSGNLALCTVDMLGISLGIYWTGQSDSSLYLLFFIPLIIQAFHRDWTLLFYYGTGSLIMYMAVILYSAREWSAPQVVEIGVRIFCMLLTMAMALLATSLLKKKEVLENRRLHKMKLLTYVAHSLNGVVSYEDLQTIAQGFVPNINLGLKDSLEVWSRIFLTEKTGSLMHAFQDPAYPRPDLEQTLLSTSCPAVQGNKNFHLKNSNTEAGCPTEKFSFGSHVCIPISASHNESYGVIFAGSPKLDAFGTEEIILLEFIGKSLGLTIQRLKRIEELKMALAMDSCAMATFVSSTRSPEATYNAILDGIKTILNADLASLMLWNPEQKRLETVFLTGSKNLQDKNTFYHLGEGAPGRALESGKPYWTYDLDNHSSEASGAAPYRALLCLPINSLKGDPLGTLNVMVFNNQRMFSVEEIDLASTFATRAAISIENALLHQAERVDSDPDVGIEKAA